MGYGPSSLATPVSAPNGGTGVANNAASTLTISGNFGTTFTISGITALTLPATGTVATTATFATPPAIGSGTPAAITGTTVTVNTKLFTAVDASRVAPSFAPIGAVAGTGGVVSGGWIWEDTSGGFSVQLPDGSSTIRMSLSACYLADSTSGGSQRVNLANQQLVTGGTVKLDWSSGVKVASGVNFQVGNNAVTGLIAGALAALTTASMVIYDATGTAYRVPCITP